MNVPYPIEVEHPPSSPPPRDLSWSFWPLLPLYPYGKRRTLRQEIVKDTIWTFDQLQGTFYVIVPIRMTVVRLEAGGLLVYAPVAPTPECVSLVRELEAKYGSVRYIIHPTVSGLEHKVFVGPFACKFPEAQVYAIPSQWSFPLELPLSWLGFPGDRTHILPDASGDTPFGQEFDFARLGPIKLGLGPFAEAVFFHKASRTLLATDAVISVPAEPPKILQLDPYPLLFHARDDVFDIVKDNPDTRCRGWQRICLFAAYIQPSAIAVVPLGQALQDATRAPDRSKRACFGLFPFEWQSNWHETFETLYGQGRIFVAPILQTLVFNRAPQETIAWADRVSQWNFERVISCHFAPVAPGEAQQFRQAFSFLEKQPKLPPPYLPPADLELLKATSKNLTKTRIAPPAKEKL